MKRKSFQQFLNLGKRSYPILSTVEYDKLYDPNKENEDSNLFFVLDDPFDFVFFLVIPFFVARFEREGFHFSLAWSWRVTLIDTASR